MRRIKTNEKQFKEKKAKWIDMRIFLVSWSLTCVIILGEIVSCCIKQHNELICFCGCSSKQVTNAISKTYIVSMIPNSLSQGNNFSKNL